MATARAAAVDFAHYVWPALRDRPREDALRPILCLHAFRFVLNNARRHAGPDARFPRDWIDPLSSAPFFDRPAPRRAR